MQARTQTQHRHSVEQDPLFPLPSPVSEVKVPTTCQLPTANRQPPPTRASTLQLLHTSTLYTSTSTSTPTILPFYYTNPLHSLCFIIISIFPYFHTPLSREPSLSTKNPHSPHLSTSPAHLRAPPESIRIQ